jgi:hypothetical protein
MVLCPGRTASLLPESDRHHSSHLLVLGILPPSHVSSFSFPRSPCQWSELGKTKNQKPNRRRTGQDTWVYEAHRGRHLPIVEFGFWNLGRRVKRGCARPSALNGGHESSRLVVSSISGTLLAQGISTLNGLGPSYHGNRVDMSFSLRMGVVSGTLHTAQDKYYGTSIHTTLFLAHVFELSRHIAQSDNQPSLSTSFPLLRPTSTFSLGIRRCRLHPSHSSTTNLGCGRQESRRLLWTSIESDPVRPHPNSTIPQPSHSGTFFSLGGIARRLLREACHWANIALAMHICIC